MFDTFLAARADGGPWEPFSADDYLAYVDGKRRVDGVRSFIASRGIVLPEGTTDDEPGHGTVNALGNAKNEAFQEVLRRDGIDPYPGSVRFLDALDRLGKAVGVVSSSRNATEVLAAAGLADRFAVVVDGNVAAARDLPGKPAPDTFLAAAAELGVIAAAHRRRRGRHLRSRRRPRRWVRPGRRRRPRRRSRRPRRVTAPTSSSTTSPSSPTCSPKARGSDASRRSRAPAAVPLPGRPVEVRRGRFLPRGASAHRDAVRRRQRLPRATRRSRGGPRLQRSRDVHQRLPRDVEHPPRRAGVRVRHDRADDRQRSRSQDHVALRRRRAARAVDRRPRLVWARARPAPRHGQPRPDLAHRSRQARAGPVAAPRVAGSPPHRGDHVRGHDGARRSTGRRRLAPAQPPGRRVRGAARGVHRVRRCRQSRTRPAAPPHVQPSRAAATHPHRRRSADGARLPVHQQQDVDRLRGAPPDRVDGDVRRRHRDQPRRGDGDRGEHAGRRAVAEGHQVRQLPHVALRPEPRRRDRRRRLRVGDSVHAQPRPRRARRLRGVGVGAGGLARRVLGEQRRRAATPPRRRRHGRRRRSPRSPSSRRCGGTCSSSPRPRLRSASRGSPPRASPAAATRATTSGTRRCTWRRSWRTRDRRRLVS